jgi:aspartate oxidase
MIRHVTDVLIVGAGLAGLQAAVACIETAPQLGIVVADLGGAASTEIMGFAAPLAAGDSADCFAADTLRAGGGSGDPALVNRLAGDAAAVVSRLERLGVAFDRRPDGAYDLLQPVGASFPRVIHQGTTTGRTIIELYRAQLSRRPNVTFRSWRVFRLLRDNGRITGALALTGGESDQPAVICCQAKSVILASGGAAGLFGCSSWSKLLRGSGYALADAAGAELTGMGHIQFEPCLTIWPDELAGFPVITTLLFAGARLLDRSGLPLYDPGRPAPRKSELARLIAQAIADGRDCGHGGVWFDFAGVAESDFARQYPGYYRKIRPYARTLAGLRLEVRPAAHTTLGGVRIDASGATPVPGLFAAGEVCGGIHGQDRIGGNAGLEVLVFGSAAGQSAAHAALGLDGIAEVTPAVTDPYLAPPPRLSAYPDRSAYLEPLAALLDRSCGVLVTPAGLNAGLTELARLHERLDAEPPKRLADRLDCREALHVGALLIKARLKEQEKG